MAKPIELTKLSDLTDDPSLKGMKWILPTTPDNAEKAVGTKSLWWEGKKYTFQIWCNIELLHFGAHLYRGEIALSGTLDSHKFDSQGNSLHSWYSDGYPTIQSLLSDVNDFWTKHIKGNEE